MALLEHFWDCPSCGHKSISALRQLKCPSCAYSKTSQDEEHRSDVEITDADGIALARGGPHWVCSSCGSVNLNKYSECQQCGNPKEGSDHKNEVRDLGSAHPPAYHRIDNEERLYNPKSEDEDQTPNASSASFLESNQDTEKIHNSFDMSLVWKSLAVLAVIAAIVFLGYLTFNTKDVPGMATGFSWSRDVVIERYQTVHDSGWSEPSGAYHVVTSQREHHRDPIYETRTKNVHHSKTCYRDLGNGSEESYDCSYDSTESEQVKVGERIIYATWYEYDIDRWVYNRTAHSEAKDHKPFWPEYSLKLKGQTVLGAERVGSTPETYTVYFVDTLDSKEHKNYSYNTNQTEWDQYQIENIYPLKVNHFDAIMNDPIADKVSLTATAAAK